MSDLEQAALEFLAVLESEFPDYLIGLGIWSDKYPGRVLAANRIPVDQALQKLVREAKKCK